MPANNPTYFSDLIKNLWQTENPEIIKWTMKTLILIHGENVQTRNFTVKKSAEYLCKQLKTKHSHWASKRNKELEQEFWEMVSTTLIESITLYYNKRNAAEILSTYFITIRQDPELYHLKFKPYERLQFLLDTVESYHHNVFKDVLPEHLSLLPGIKTLKTPGLGSSLLRIKGEKADFIINAGISITIIYIVSVIIYLLYSLVNLDFLSGLQSLLSSPYFWIPGTGAVTLMTGITKHRNTQVSNFIKAFKINTIELDILLQKDVNRSVSFTMFKTTQASNNSINEISTEGSTTAYTSPVSPLSKPKHNLVAPSIQAADKDDGRRLLKPEKKKSAFFSAPRKKTSYKKAIAIAQTPVENSKDADYVVIEGTKKPNTQFLFYNIQAIEAQIKDHNLRKAYKAIAEYPRIVRQNGAAGLVKINQKFSPFIKDEHTSGQLAVSCYQIKSPKYDERVMVRLVREDKVNKEELRKYFVADTVLNHKQKKLFGTVKRTYERGLFPINKKNSANDPKVQVSSQQFSS